MQSREFLKKQFLDIVDNQTKANDPPETKQTLNRLKEMGYGDHDARMLIAQCVVVEMFDILKHGRLFDQKRYINNLNRLPKEPFED